MDLTARCNNITESAKLCPPEGVENTLSMDPVVIRKPYNVEEGYSTDNKLMKPKFVRLEMNVGEEKTFNFTWWFWSHTVHFSDDFPENLERKIFLKNSEIHSSLRSFGGTDNFQLRLKLKSCPEDPLLWKENHYQFKGNDESMHIFLRFLCSCSCDRFSTDGKICSNEQKVRQSMEMHLFQARILG